MVVKTVIIYLDHIERLNFYSRFFSEDKKFTFFTAKYSIYYKAKRMGLNIYLVYVSKKISCKIMQVDRIPCRERVQGVINQADSNILRQSIYDFLNSAHIKPFEVECFLIWNGSDVADSVIKLWCDENKVNCIFLEISNLPSKLFVDKKGVNFQSYLSTCDEGFFENLYTSSNEGYVDYLEKYKEIKSGSYVAPQSKLAIKINFWFALDYMACVLKITPKVQSKSLFYKLYQIYNRLISSRSKIFYGKVPDSEFNFLPLQLSTDSQILLNSSVDNEEAIRYSCELSKKMNADLVVKIHPAEKDKDKLKKYLSLAKKNNFIISRENTNDLIKKSGLIITINSTVGLEALLFNKETKFLGETFYKKLNKPEYIEGYVQKYLFDCDYYGYEDIDFDRLQKHFFEISGV